MDQKLVAFLLEKGFLVSPDFFYEGDLNQFLEEFNRKIKTRVKPLFLSCDLLGVVESEIQQVEVNWIEFEKSRALFDSGRDGRLYGTFLQLMSFDNTQKNRLISNLVLKSSGREEESLVMNSKNSRVKIFKNYVEKMKKREVKDFVDHYLYRFNFLKGILQQRAELQNVTSIHRVLQKGSEGSVVLIGMVSDKSITKNENILLTIEDLGGSVKLLVNKNKEEVYQLAKDVTLDETIGIIGVLGKEIVFVNGLFFPDIPEQTLIKKSKDGVYVAFIADLQVGSSYFNEKAFLKFIEWLNCSSGNDKQKEIASKVSYLFILGDVVDGVGVYPGQDQNLLIEDIFQQYEHLATLLKMIRKDIKIVICGGNHDALRLAEPQPILDKNYAASIHNLDNVILVTNPSLVNIHSNESFEGFDILMYHGASFHFYISNIESLREGSSKPTLLLKYFLQKRHLAVSHGSSLFIPDPERDDLLIEKIPDIFVTGEMHKVDVSNYKGVILISCGCWQYKTDVQVKRGIEPDIGKVPLLNLQTREIKIINFTE